MFAQFRFWSFSSLFLLIISACNNPKAPTGSAPSEGLPGEVLVVSSTDQLDEVKEAFVKYFTLKDSNLLIAENAEKQEFEPMFGFWHVGEKAIEGSEKLSSMMVVWGEAGNFGSVLDGLKATEKHKTSNGVQILVFKNVWAKPQTVVQIVTGKMDISDVFKGEFSAELAQILSKNEVEQGFPGNLASNAYTDSISKLLMQNYGFAFQFPPQFRLSYSNNEVIWLKQETGKFYRHIFVNLFSDSVHIDSISQAISNRNHFTGKYISNEEGTFTLVSRSDLFPKSFKTQANGIQVLRGWYQEEGTFRRGPFVRYIFHDVSGKRYIAVDGFVFAPDSKRLPFYRLFDLIANTVTISK